MGTIARGVKSGTGTTAFGAGTTALSSEVNTDLNTVYTLVNGNIENVNIKAGAAIASSKVNLASITQNIALTGTLDVTGDLTVSGSISGSLMPVGAIIEYAGITAPTGGWLTCDGQAVSRTTYSDLFTSISTTYGAGDTTTTFNVPNKKGRVSVGQDASQTEFDTLGETGGANTVTLTAATVPSHTHTITGGVSADGGASGTLVSIASLTSNVTYTTSSYGGGAAHSSLQPYLVTNFYIKY